MTDRQFRKMQSRLMDVFSAELVDGGYSSREIPWEIGAQMMAGGRTSRTGKLLPSEELAKKRATREVQERREQVGPKPKRRGGGKVTRKAGGS